MKEITFYITDDNKMGCRVHGQITYLECIGLIQHYGMLILTEKLKTEQEPKIEQSEENENND